MINYYVYVYVYIYIYTGIPFPWKVKPPISLEGFNGALSACERAARPEVAAR